MPGNENIKSWFREEWLLVQLELQEHGLAMVRKEIYENIGQVLSLVKLYLSEHFLDQSRSSNKARVLSQKLVGRAISDLRLAIKPVSAEEVRDQGIVPAIQHELDTLERISQRKTKFTTSKKIFRFDPTKELIVFRIMQEGINAFAARDAGKQLTVTASYRKKEVTFLISFGIQPKPGIKTREQERAIDPESIFGNAQKMQVRAELIEASLAFSGTATGDRSILLRLPIS